MEKPFKIQTCADPLHRQGTVAWQKLGFEKILTSINFTVVSVLT